MTPCTLARLSWSPFSFGAASAALWPAPVPGRLFLCPLASCTTKLTHADVEVRFLRSRANLALRWTRWRSLSVWPSGPHREKKRASLALAGRPSTVVLVGRHTAGLPCRPESEANVASNPGPYHVDLLDHCEKAPGNITCDEKKIPLVSNTRLLVVIADSNLSWKDHGDQVCLKVNRKIGAVRRSFRQLTPSARRAFFLSVIQPDLEYAASAIVPSMAVSQKNRLLATWRRAVRGAAGRGYQDNVAPLVKQLKIVSLEHRWALQVAEIVFRCNHGSACDSSPTRFPVFDMELQEGNQNQRIIRRAQRL